MRKSGKPAVTSGDVARLAKVSQSAVSRALTAGASVSEKTRAKVLKAASEAQEKFWGAATVAEGTTLLSEARAR